MYKLKPYDKPQVPFAWWEGAFTEEELDWLQQKARSAVLDSEVASDSGNVVVEKLRRSQVLWLHNTSENNWVYERLSEVASSLNADYFCFDLENIELLQLTNYLEEDKGVYGWHRDFGLNSARRKLSLVLQLSNPSEYEGGELQIRTKSTPDTMDKNRGSITAFPAWTLHQVTPVTRGDRQSLVAWVSGAPFK